MQIVPFESGMTEQVIALWNRCIGEHYPTYSVWHNKQRGVVDMVIDWTDLVGFYGRIGFKIWKRYWQGSKTLA